MYYDEINIADNKDLVPFVQFKKRERVVCSKVTGKTATLGVVCSKANVTKSNTAPLVFFAFFVNCANGTKSHKTSHLCTYR